MMKFWAKVILKKKKNGGVIFQEYVRNSNPENIFRSEGKRLIVKVAFDEDKQPTDLIAAINKKSKIIEMHYGELRDESFKDEWMQWLQSKQKVTVEENDNGDLPVSQEEDNNLNSGTEEKIQKELEELDVEELLRSMGKQEVKEETEQKKETFKEEEAESQQQEATSDEEEKSEQEEEKCDKEEVSEQEEEFSDKEETVKEEAQKRKRVTRNSAKTEALLEKVNSIAELAKKSKSYEEFTKGVAEWLELDKVGKCTFFTNLVEAAGELNKITWNAIVERLESKQIECKVNYKVLISKRLEAKIQDDENAVTFMELIKIMVAYKNYDFDQVPEGGEEENVGVTNEQLGNLVKMDCMPEILWFEEKLSNLDKTQTVEERVNGVLEIMGLKKVIEERQKYILEIANTAMELEDITTNSIVSSVNIPQEKSSFARMAFSDFINVFVKENYEGEAKVKLYDFLRDLQKVVKG